MNAPLDDEERETAALLTQLKVTPSTSARERAFAKLQQDFQALHAPRRTRARWAIAAGVVVTLLAGWMWRGMQPVPLVARVESLDGGVEARGAGWLARKSRLVDGGSLAAGSSLRVAADGGVLLRLSPDLTVRLAAKTRATINAVDELELTEGRAFIDATPGAHAPLRVITPFGEVTHLGTQYQVRTGGNEIEVAVREGRAQFTNAGATRVAEAGQWLLHHGADATVLGTVAPADPRFEWIGNLPTEFRLEGVTLAGFLAWFQRETGLTPIYSDSIDAGQFTQVQLKGSIDDLQPLEALSFVLATADLAWHREGPKVIIEKRLSATG
jgi:ferric-dicitrate binding protein FerR (iron transport regulator)